MTSKASICSVTLMVPMLEVMYEPTLPAKMIDIKVGANSRIIDLFVAKPIKYLGIHGLSTFKAVCIATTPPTKNDIKATIPIDLRPNSSTSLKRLSLKTDLFCGFLKTWPNMIKYNPIFCKYFISITITLKY